MVHKDFNINHAKYLVRIATAIYADDTNLIRKRTKIADLDMENVDQYLDRDDVYDYFVRPAEITVPYTKDEVKEKLELEGDALKNFLKNYFLEYRMKELGITDFHFLSIEETNTQVLIAIDDNRLNENGEPEHRIIIAFRGTERRIDDILTDVKIKLIDNPVDQKVTEDDRAKTHQGFTEAALSSTDEILGIIKSHLPGDEKPLRLFLTGHSLGAALSTLFAYWLVNQLHQDPELGAIEEIISYNFGSPKVGNSDFAKNFESSIQSNFVNFRVVNDQDLVTQVPPDMFGYAYIPLLVRIDNEGNLFSTEERHESLLEGFMEELRAMKSLEHIKDHNPWSYVDQLDKLHK